MRMRARQGAAAVPVGISRARVYFPELESLRGLAILLVFAYHAVGIFRAAEPTSPDLAGTWVLLPLALVYAGQTGVNLFFILSAFLLSMPFLDAARGGSQVAVVPFYRRRALRILPLYWTVVTAAAIFGAWRARAVEPLLSGAAYMLFLTPFLDVGAALWPFSVPWWSLATEVHFYLLLPLLGVLVRSRWRLPLIIFVLILWVAAYGSFMTGHLHASTIAGQLSLRSSAFGRSPFLVAGIAAAALYQWRGEELRQRLARAPWARCGGGDLFVALCLVTLALVLQWTVYVGPTEAEARAGWRFAEAVCWTGVLLTVLLAPLRARSLVENPVLNRLGVLSYSIYLVHVPLLCTIPLVRLAHPTLLEPWPWMGVATLGGLTVCTLGCAVVTYRFIELPFLTRKGQISG